MENNKLIFTCPKCGETFTLEELVDHNNQALIDYINERTNKELNEKQEVLLKQLKEELDKEYALKQQKDESKFNQEKNDLVLNFNKKENDIREINKNKEYELQSKIVELQNQLANLNSSLQDKIGLSESKLKEQYENQLNEKDKKLVDLQHKYETTNIDLQNQNKALNEAIKSLKQANEQQLLLAKQTITNEFKDSLQEKQSMIESLKLKNETSLQTKELELVKKYNDIVEQKDTEINELKIQNNLNRVIHSKTKGENFEHEVEGELRKAFGFADEIEKINETTNNKKADYLQSVLNPNKQEIGKIVYEVKNAKWSDSWIPKLIADCANNKTKYGILIATSFSDRYHDVPFIKSKESDNIFITDPFSFIFVAQLLRKIIVIENEMKVNEQVLKNSEDNELLKQYETKINAIKEFMISDLPIYQKSFNKQIKDIESVRKSLDNNSNKLTKSINMLKSKTEKLVFQRLSQLTEIAIENDESLEPINDQEID